MGKTGFLLDDRFLRHDTGPRHPESPARLGAIRDAYEQAGLGDRCRRVEAKEILTSNLLRLHSRTYVTRVDAACRQSLPFIDVPDSAICPDSYEIALLAAGGTTQAVDLIMSGDLTNAFCAVRPPGHHAERDQSMGFCLFNNVGLAAERLLRYHELERVMVIDWDVHHGNGTQHAFEHVPEVYFCSLHGHPLSLYPGTGFETEVGTGEGEGYTLNIPMMPGTTGERYRQAFDEQILPAAEVYKPQFLLVSAGYDAHRLDPLAPLCLEVEDFEWMTRAVLDLAERHCQGRLISVLEGGYNLDVLSECVTMHISLLADAGTSERRG